MNQDVCYFYYRTNRYRVTVAYRRGEDNRVSYGAAFCRPEDPFVKRRGRQIAEGRMRMNGDYVSADNETPRWRVHEAILDHLSYDGPEWVPHNFHQ
jgi:hypothetical protein